MSRRDSSEIIGDILIALRDFGTTMKPTWLMYRSRLSYPLFKSYLSKLLNSGLVETVEGKRKRTYLKITDKGIDFLNHYLQSKEFERSFGL